MFSEIDYKEIERYVKVMTGLESVLGIIDKTQKCIKEVVAETPQNSRNPLDEYSEEIDKIEEEISVIYDKIKDRYRSLTKIPK